MKKRIQVDSLILAAIFVLTIVISWFGKLYSKNLALEDILFFLGIILILKGMFLRMGARGHKKTHSQKGKGLVMTGPYTLVRNPMYLGTFIVGLGFTFIVWPWWTWPVFAVLFYMRFIRQIKIEERYLSQIFGREFEAYCQAVPRLWPTWKVIKQMRCRDVLCLPEAWSTKEKWGIITWPAVALFAEILQRQMVFQAVDVVRLVVIFAASIGAFVLVLWLEKKRG